MGLNKCATQINYQANASHKHTHDTSPVVSSSAMNQTLTELAFVEKVREWPGVLQILEMDELVCRHNNHSLIKHKDIILEAYIKK